MGRRINLGKHNGNLIVADYPCSDECPDHTVRMIHYDTNDPARCAALGGQLREIDVPYGIGLSREAFCFPNLLIENWNAYMKYSCFQCSQSEASR